MVRATRRDPRKAGGVLTPRERWAAECAEWQAIKAELIASRPDEIVTAHQVTLEHKKRALARGEKLMVYPDDFNGFDLDES
jgi:hypothetical protein